MTLIKIQPQGTDEVVKKPARFLRVYRFSMHLKYSLFLYPLYVISNSRMLFQERYSAESKKNMLVELNGLRKRGCLTRGFSYYALISIFDHFEIKDDSMRLRKNETIE